MTLINATIVNVTLTDAELAHAAIGGVLRQVENLRAGLHDAYGLTTAGWGEHITGACAEYAVATWLGRTWTPGERGAGDVGVYQVRYAAKATHSLIIHPDDDDRAPFILVTGGPFIYTLAGWVWGIDGKLQQYWSDPTGAGRPAFFVPQSALYRMDELITDLWD